MPDKVSIYIHVPFCRHRCAYCDFNTYAGMSRYLPAYVDALCDEIHSVVEKAPERLSAHTIFFGGGTPSLLPVEFVERILADCRQYFDLTSDAEISMEANPGTISLEWLRQVRLLGVNRLSFGMQSADLADLAVLEREHDTFDVIRAVEWSRQAGIDNLNLDLIFGIPGQTIERWANTLDFTLRLNPEHLSLYSLAVEPGTPFKRWVDRGLVEMPDDDLAADMYELACAQLDEAGYSHYEISNWALHAANRDYRCRHNLQYWQMKPYLGFGAGAHGFAAGTRTANARGIRAYIQKFSEVEKNAFPAGPGAETVLPVDAWTEMQETMMVGLRLLESGVSAGEFEKRFGIALDRAFAEQIQSLIKTGLLEWCGDSADHLRLTRRGWLLGNRVFREFVDLPKPAGIG